MPSIWVANALSSGVVELEREGSGICSQDGWRAVAGACHPCGSYEKDIEMLVGVEGFGPKNGTKS
jgi:hypothetical protein